VKRIQLENRTDLKSEIPLDTPYCIFIDPSSFCNLKCAYCMNYRIKKPVTMKFDLFRKIIDDLKEFDKPIKTIRLYAFGEPFLNRAFCEMVKYAKASEKVLSVDTTTNGTMLGSEWNKQLVDSGIDRINVSVAAIDREKYREFTRNKVVSLSDIIDGIADLYHQKNKTTVFVKANADYMTDEEKELFFKTFKPISDGCSLEHTMECWKDAGLEAGNKEVGLYGNLRKEVMVCPYIFYGFTIHADGLASACFLDWNRKLVIGDVTIESMKDLWNDKLFNHLRMLMLRKGRKQHPICRNCDQLIAGMPVDLDEYAGDILARMGKKNG